MYQVHIVSNINSILDSFQLDKKHQICRGRKANALNNPVNSSIPYGDSNSQDSIYIAGENSTTFNAANSIPDDDAICFRTNFAYPDFICIIGDDPTDAKNWKMAIEVKNPWIDYKGPFDQNTTKTEFNEQIGGEYEQVIKYMENYNLKYSVLTNFIFHWFFKFENGNFYITERLDLNELKNHTIYEWLFALINDNEKNPLNENEIIQLKVKFN